MLTFNLKKEWFEKIKSGEKTHEYRVMSDYWIAKIMPELNFNFEKMRFELPLYRFTNRGLKVGDSIVFTNGYPSEKNKEKRLMALVTNIKYNVDGRDTDLKVNKLVFDIEFELIERGKNNDR